MYNAHILCILYAYNKYIHVDIIFLYKPTLLTIDALNLM